MDDLISRQDAVIALVGKGQASKRYKLGQIWELNFDEIREAIAKVPSAQPERKKGKWMRQESDYFWADICSECRVAYIGENYGMFNKPPVNYCPNCGAYMRGE